MILADTSAWVEYLRGTGSDTHRALRSAIRGGDLVVTEPVLMEVLAGALTDRQARSLRAAMLAFPIVPIQVDDYEQAAAIHRKCRAAGRTIRDIVDCMVAAVAIRTDASVLHRDRDFDAIANHTELRIQR